MKQAFLAFACLALAATPALDAQSPGCAPSNGLGFICDLQKPEDLVLLPDTRWLIASGMEAGSGLHLIDTRAKRAQTLWTSGAPARPDKNRFANCPDPLDPQQAVLHGLSLRSAPAGHFTLYSTNHGGRESIEVFDIDGRGATPSATWVGCVLMPDKLAANSVAAFGDGALLATVVSLPGKTSPDGRNTGAVFMWTPGDSVFHRLDGTELPVNNGIETSADGREFFVVSMGLRQIVAFSRADPSKPIGFAQLSGFTPDNVRMVGTRLVAAGMAVADPSCVAGTPCPRGFAAQAIDPKTLVVSDLGRWPATPPYGGTATAIPIDGEIWLSSYNGDRVAYGPLSR
ncbi:MAG: hypothetical protein ABJA98_15865 [Acidobacteriota bacterium]